MDIGDILYEFVGAAFIIIASFISLKLFFKRKSKLLASFFLAWFAMGLYVLIAGLSVLLESVLIEKINDSVFPALSLLSFLVFLDYAQNDGLSPKKIGFGLFVFSMLFTWVWYPGNIVAYDDVAGVFTYSYYDAYFQVQNICFASLAFVIVYWFVITAKSLPPSLSRLKPYLYIGAAFGLSAGVPVFVTNIFPDLMTVTFIGTVGMAFVSTFAIRKDPRIVHLLPFKVYRLLITSKGGSLYYEKNWNTIDVDSVMIAGMMSAINTFSKGALKERKEDDGTLIGGIDKPSDKFDAGAISEIKLSKAVLLSEMKYTPVNIFLLSSKASKDLKASMDDFSNSFVAIFKDDLYTNSGFPIEIEVGRISVIFNKDKIDGLVNKYFSNIPDFIS